MLDILHGFSKSRYISIFKKTDFALLSIEWPWSWLDKLALHYDVKRTETHFDLCLNLILGKKVANKMSRGLYFKQEYQILGLSYSYSYEKNPFFQTW